MLIGVNTFVPNVLFVLQECLNDDINIARSRIKGILNSYRSVPTTKHDGSPLHNVSEVIGYGSNDIKKICRVLLYILTNSTRSDQTRLIIDICTRLITIHDKYHTIWFECILDHFNNLKRLDANQLAHYVDYNFSNINDKDSLNFTCEYMYNLITNL